MGRLGLPGLGLLARHNVGGPLTPKDLIPGVIFQGDPDDPRNDVIGLGLDRFANQVAGGPDARQTNNNDRPALLTGGGMNGHNGAHFDFANTEFMDLALANASQDYTVFAALDQLSAVPGGAPQMLWALNGALDAVLIKGNGTPFAGLVDSVAWREAVTAKTGEQLLTWRIDSTGPDFEVYRDGALLGVAAYDGTLTCGPNGVIGGPNHMDAILSYLVIVDHTTTPTETAIVHAWLADRFARTASLHSIANLGAWWDLDYSTQSGGVLTGLTDLALADTLNIVGSPAIVSIGGKDYVRMDGTDDVIWMADKAALDGANGCTHVLKHANTLPNPLAGATTYCQKGRQAVHRNGGLVTDATAGTRFSVKTAAGNANLGPLAEFTSPAETIACALESGAAVRRVDGDGTYASNATGLVSTVGVGALSWGAIDNTLPNFTRWGRIDLRKAAYYNRPLNQYELIAAHALMDASP